MQDDCIHRLSITILHREERYTHILRYSQLGTWLGTAARLCELATQRNKSGVLNQYINMHFNKRTAL